MKTKCLFPLCCIILTSSWIVCAHAQGTAFTYQARLNDGTGPANGAYNVRFALFDAMTIGNQVGAPVTNSPVNVINGLFTVTLDFGAGLFAGADRWLEIAVRTNGGGAFTTLAPRQPLTPTPYAITAGSVLSGGLAAGAYGNAVTLNNVANQFTGTFIGNGANATNVNAATLNSLTSAGFWKTNGNTGANPTNGAFLGTADNLPLEFKVNSQRGLRLEPTAALGTVNVIGGSLNNVVSNGFSGAVIAGGGHPGAPNRAGEDYAAVLGGLGNTASGYASTAMGYNTIASGFTSTAMGYFTKASVYATAMGYGTIASGGVATAMGDSTTASGYVSTAMGYHARALHDGSFVWADDASVAYFSSTAANQFLLRASGGVGINTTSPQSTLDVAGEIRWGSGSTLSADALAGIELRNSTAFATPFVDFHYGLPNVSDYNARIINDADGQLSFYAAARLAQFNATGLTVPSLIASSANPYTSPQVVISQQNTADHARLQIGVNTFPQWTLAVSPSAAPVLNFWNGSANVAWLDYNGTFHGLVFSPTSDRNAKENFKPVSPREVLEKVAALPISEWNFKTAPGEEHIGPMAQDFRAAFGTGADDKHIATVDADGVALAAIQGLNQKLEETRSENAQLKARLERLELLLADSMRK